MALDPLIRAELERLGPANVKELLRTGAGSGRNAPVAVQLAGVPDPIRGDVEDWLREKEREGEAVTRDTLKWAKTAGIAAIIGVVAGIIGAIAGIRSCSYSSSSYDEQNRPKLTMTNYAAEANDFFKWQVSNGGNEDATEIRFKFAGIDPGMHSATPLTSERPSLWPRLLKSGADRDWVRIQVSRNKFSYLLVCIEYMSERGQRRFPAEDEFLALAGWLPGMVNLVAPPGPERAEGDKLRATFSCAKL
jgi:hypothetical protein